MDNASKKSWSLIDADQLAIKSPDIIAAPSKEVIEPLEKGSDAKLVFSIKNDDPSIPNVEQLWVELLLVQDNKYLGQIKDNPIYIKDLKRGEMIEFEDRHIIKANYINPMHLMEKSN